MSHLISGRVDVSAAAAATRTGDASSPIAAAIAPAQLHVWAISFASGQYLGQTSPVDPDTGYWQLEFPTAVKDVMPVLGMNPTKLAADDPDLPADSINAVVGEVVYAGTLVDKVLVCTTAGTGVGTPIKVDTSTLTVGTEIAVGTAVFTVRNLLQCEALQLRDSVEY